MEKLLIVGVEQVVGANLALVLSERFSVLGLSHQQPASIAGCRTVPCNLEDADHVAWQIGRFAPDWTIVCGQLSRSSWDAPAGRVAGAAGLAVAAARTALNAKSRVAVISSDAVFSGPKLFHDESAPTVSNPLADEVRAMETALVGTSVLVVRTHAYGWSCCDAHVSFAERIWNARQPAGGDSAPVHEAAGSPKLIPSPYACATPILASDLAPLLLRAYELGLSGLFHVAGAERASQRRFAAELAAAAGQTAIACAGAPNATARHGSETSLVSQRAQHALQLAVPMLREGLARFAAQHDDGFRLRLRGESAMAHAA